MFRPICTIGHRASSESTFKAFIRHKVVHPASILKPAEKIKLYHKENKELFGPLLDPKKQKKNRIHKEVKNSLHKNSSVKDTQTKCGDSSVAKVSAHLGLNNCVNAVQILKTKMWPNTRSYVNVLGVLLNNTVVRSYSTSSVRFAARSSPAEPGYSSEDKVLQIKQHKNDYAEQYPSVTLILNKTMTEQSKNALDKWKQERIAELGEEEFKKFYEAQMGLGTKLHNTLKTYFTQPQSQLRIEKDIEGVWTSVSEVLKSISTPKAIESNVIHPVLKYRGIFDAIADYEDKPTLIEWKKSDKPRKSLALTYDNPVQLAAYFGAVSNDLNYKHLNVRDALLVICYTDGSKADAYHLPTDKLREHWAQWLSRLEEYIKKHGNEPEKILKGGKRLFEEDVGNLQ